MGFIGQDVSDGERERNYPLPDRNERDDGVHQVGGQFVHPPAAAGGAEASALTREGDKPLRFTRLTPKACKPVSQNPTTKVGLDLLINVGRQRASGGVSLGDGQERLEILLDRPVENRPLRFMPGMESPNRCQGCGSHPIMQNDPPTDWP